VSQSVFKGQWSSGEKASAIPVTVVFDAGGIEFGSAQAGQLGFWHYADLLAGAPILKRTGDVLLRNRLYPHASLFIEGKGAAALVLDRAPHTSENRLRLKIVGLSLVAAAIAIGAGALLFFGGGSTTKAIARLIPQEVASKIGRQNVEVFGTIAPSCLDRRGNAALQRILRRLQKAAGPSQTFTLHVVQSNVANAFALPGGHIVLLSALVKEAEGPEEVAGVLAHEMGHEIERDPEAMFVRNVGMQTLITLFTGSGNGGTALQAGAVLLQLRYSREAERMADAHAVDILKKAGVSPKPAGNFFLRHAAAEDGEIGVSYLSTHPDSRERAKLFRSQPSYRVAPLLSAREWAHAKTLCGK
jgi:predicted Zn-dependent protease